MIDRLERVEAPAVHHRAAPAAPAEGRASAAPAPPTATAVTAAPEPAASSATDAAAPGGRPRTGGFPPAPARSATGSTRRGRVAGAAHCALVEPQTAATGPTVPKKHAH